MSGTPCGVPLIHALRCQRDNELGSRVGRLGLREQREELTAGLREADVVAKEQASGIGRQLLVERRVCCPRLRPRCPAVMRVEEPVVRRQRGWIRRVETQVVVRHADRAVGQRLDRRRERLHVGSCVDPDRRRPGDAAVERLRERNRGPGRGKRSVLPDDESSPFGPASMSGMMSPVRSGVPSSGSLTNPGTYLLTVIGSDHVTPRSSETITAISWPFLIEPEPWKSVNTSTSRPACGPPRTTEIWWP